MKIKKLLSFLLVACMAMGMFGVNVFATGENSITLNNTTLTFQKIVYVSPTGNDTTGDGAETTPFMSLRKAMDYFADNGYKEDVAVVMEDGEYDWTPIASGTGGNMDAKYNQMKVSFIAKNLGKVYIHSNVGLELGLAEINANYKIKLSFYGVIFHKIPTSIDVGVHLNNDLWENEFYNCVFKDIQAIGGWNYYVNTASAKVVNCAFINCNQYFWNGAHLNGTTLNSASTNTVLEPDLSTKITSLTNIRFDNDYQIISDGWQNVGTGTNPDGTQANIGVYGGEFAWGYTSSTPGIDGFYLVLEVDETITASVSDDLSDNALFNWNSSSEAVASVDVDGVITAKTPGTTIITCENSDEDFNDTIPVLVVEKGKAKEYRLAVTLSPDKTCKLTYKNLENLAWASNDTTIASVDANGKVTATAKGLAYVTVKDDEDVEVGKIYVRVI